MKQPARSELRTGLLALATGLATAATLSAQAIAVPPRPSPSRPPPRAPAGCCAYVDGLVAYDYALVPSVQVAGTLAPTAPPPPKDESPGTLPGGGMAWVAGYWVWNGSEFVWDAGRWVPIPVGATTWLPGRWESRTDGYAWVAGRWK